MNKNPLTLLSVTLNSRNIESIEKRFREGEFSGFDVVVKIKASQERKEIRRFNSSTLTILYSEDLGIYDAINQALSLVQTRYYMVFGDDDHINCQVVANCLKSLKVHISLIEPAFISGLALNRATNEMGRYHSVGYIIATAIHDELGQYSTRFKIASDQLLISSLQDKPSLTVPIVFGTYGGSGISSRGLRVTVEHWLAVMIGSFRRILV